jgi:hypothetical protein
MLSPLQARMASGDIRVLESVDAVIVTKHHLDRRLDRLNLIVENGLVVQAPFR